VRKTWPNLEVYIYSRESFWADYCPALVNNAWFKNNAYPIWTAQYIQPAKSYQTTFADVAANHLPTVKPLDWGDGSGWDFWQFTGDVCLIPGITEGANLSAVDISIYKDSKLALWDRIGFVPKTPVPVTPPVTPTADYTQLYKDLDAVTASIADIKSIYK
jgi:hypothetical protein